MGRFEESYSASWAIQWFHSKVFYSTVPVEVILFDGKPVYAKIPQTQLLYATNTDSAFFLYTPTNEYYFLAGAGRGSAPRTCRENGRSLPWICRRIFR